MTTSYYMANNLECHQRMSKRLLFILNAANPGRDTAIWCGILEDVLANTPRGKIYRKKIWNRAGSAEPTLVVDAVCRELLECLQAQAQMPLFSAALLQEMAGGK